MLNKIVLVFLGSLLPLSLAYSATNYLKTQDQVTNATAAARNAQKDHRNGVSDSDPFAALNALLKQGIGLDPKQIPVQTAPLAPVKQAAPIQKPTTPIVRPTEPTESGISGTLDHDEPQNNDDNNVQLNF